MLLTTILALISAVAAITAILGGARTEKRGMRKHELVVLSLTVLTFLVGAYQTWSSRRLEQFHNSLSIEWEKELDRQISGVRIGVLFPKGSTVEQNVANMVGSMRFQFQGSPQITLRLMRAPDGTWGFTKDSGSPTPVTSAVYGSPLKVDNQRYCWWSDHWEAPPPIFLDDHHGKHWKDRNLCSLQLQLPVDAFPLSRLRSLSDIKQLAILVDKYDDKQLCEGECVPIISILVSTGSNRFDISPFQEMTPVEEHSSLKWSSTGDGIKERLHLAFTQREGLSIRESIDKRLTLLDKLTEHRESVKIYGVFEIFPRVPHTLESDKTFIAKYGQSRELMTVDRWCGIADNPEACMQQMAVVGAADDAAVTKK